MRKQIFKRSFAGLVAIGTMCAAMPAFNITAAQTLAGDVDLDGAVSVVDVVMMQKYLFGKASLSQNAYDNANVAADNAVNAFDLAVLKKMVVSDPISNEVSIYLSDSGIRVEGDDNNVVAISGKTAKITASGLYHVYGDITEGQIYVETATTDVSDVELELNDVTMTNSTMSCIYTSAASGSEKTKITVNGTNTLTDNAAAAYAESGVIYTNNKLTITKSSTGTLNVNSSMNTGIYAAKKMNLNGGTIVVNTADFSDTADADAIVADNELEIEGATIDIDSSADGLKSKDEGVFLISGDVTVKAGNDAVQGVTEITISGGTLNAGGDRGFRLDEAGKLNITGGKVLATATDYQVTGAGVTVDLSGSTQTIMMMDMAAEWTKDNTVVIGSNTYQPIKKYSYVLVSDAALTANGSYNVYVGGSQMNHSTDASGNFQNTAATTQYYSVAAMGSGTTPTGDNTVTEVVYSNSSVTLYNASGAVVSTPTNVTASGATVTVIQPSVISVSGSSTSGQMIVDVDKTTYSDGVVELDLVGLNLSNSTTSPIYVAQIGDECQIVAKSGSTNTISDGTSYTNADGGMGAIYSCDDLKIKGSGSLTVNGNAGDGIVSKNDLKVYNGSITVTAADDCIRGKDSVTVGDVDDTDFSTLVLDLTSKAGDGIKSNCQDASTADKTYGLVDVNGGTITINAYGDGIQAAQVLNVNGGTLDITTTGSKDSGSAKGLKGGLTDDETGTTTTGVVNVNGGYIELNTNDDGINSNGDINMLGGKTQITVKGTTSGYQGLHADAAVNLGSDGKANVYDDMTLVIYQAYEGIEAMNIYQKSGTTIVSTTDDAYNVAGGADNSGSSGGWPGQGGTSSSGAGTLAISGGFSIVSVASGDHDGYDSNGSLTISGGICVTNGQDAFDCDGGISYTGGVYVKDVGSQMGGMGGMGGSSSMTESVNVSTSVSAGTRVTLCDGSGNIIVSFIADKSCSSLVAGCTSYSGASFYTGGTLNGSTYFQELDQTQLAAYGGTLSGGTAVSGSSSGNQWG